MAQEIRSEVYQVWISALCGTCLATSQLCPECGATAKKDLSERVHDCPCGCRMDRDTAASLNILVRGQTAWTGPPRMVAAQAAA